MDNASFKRLVAEEYSYIPTHITAHLVNTALLVEDEPNPATRKSEELTTEETLLGLYRGVPANARGEWYGVGATVPDTITLYQKPILEAALTRRLATDEDCVRSVIRETLWHEIGHAMGLSEEGVDMREKEGTNYFRN